jgi:hypothetical protein
MQLEEEYEKMLDEERYDWIGIFSSKRYHYI